jgi:pyrimidine-nucleoside phosphorylase
MNPVELIIRKREGGELKSAEMKQFITDYINGNIDSSQMTALLMAIYFQGMTKSETRNLTEVYINSGSRITFPPEMPTVDKHSTGGVGDKISLMLAPIVAACGIPVPMISGRGLGHTGGTLDKLEAIPGFRTDFSQQEFMSFVNTSGLSIISQSEKLVPADRLIYALRDTTGTVESLPLITASIMGKKIAEGARNLVIDLKVGSGAFMTNLKRAQQLGELLASTGEGFGQKVKVIYTNMNSPLGYYCGNALETREAIDYLKGEASPDIDIITRRLAAEMLLLSGVFPDMKSAFIKVDIVIKNGSALAKLAEMIQQQKGDVGVIDKPEILPTARYELPVIIQNSGWIKVIDSRQIGYALVSIGAGRKTLKSKLDMSAGAWLPHKIGAKLTNGEILGKVYCNDKAAGEAAAERIKAAYEISDTVIDSQELILNL